MKKEMIRSTTLVCSTLTLACVACFSILSAQVKPLLVEDVVRTKRVGSVGGISPTGDWVAYTTLNRIKRVPPKDEKGTYFTPKGTPYLASGSELWVSNLSTSEELEIQHGPWANWGPSWSPDGKFLAFYSDKEGAPQLWLWEASTRRTRRWRGVAPT